LPTGLIFSASTGVISGTIVNSIAYASGQLTTTVSAVYSYGATVSTTLTFAIQGFTYSSTSLTTIVNSNVIVPSVVYGSSSPSSFTITYGTLPAGLVLSSTTGIISGIPNSPTVTTKLTVTITGNYDCGHTVSVTITISHFGSNDAYKRHRVMAAESNVTDPDADYKPSDIGLNRSYDSPSQASIQLTSSISWLLFHMNNPMFMLCIGIGISCAVLFIACYYIIRQYRRNMTIKPVNNISNYHHHNIIV